MSEPIPQSRMFLYLVLSGLLLPLLSVGYFFIEQQEVNTLHSLVDEIHSLHAIHQRRESLNTTVRHHFRDNDHFYIDKHIESIPLREVETEILEVIANQHHVTDNEAVKKRLEFLKNNNKIAFSEGVVQPYPYFRETMETLIHPVEIDVNDFQNILAKVEGIEIGPHAPGPNRPQLIISECKLQRKKIWDTNELFTLHLKILKREFF